MTDSRFTTRFLTVAIVLGAVIMMIAFLGVAQRRGIVQKHSYDALITVAWASLDYLRETGKVPEDVNTLVEAGILHYDRASGKLVSDRPERYGSVIAEYALRVRVSFPRTTEGYVLRDGAVVRSDNGQPLTLAYCDGIDPGMVTRANRALASEWYSILTKPKEAKQSSTSRP